MTSPDKPDTVDGRTESADEERTVATAAGQADASKPTSATTGTSGTVAGTVSGTASENGTNGKPVEKPTMPVEKPTMPVAKPTVTIAKPAEPASAGPTVVTPPVSPPPVAPPPVSPVEGPEVTSASPPPWQRVGVDTQYIAGNTPTETGEPAGRFADWGYQRSPRSDAYSDGGVPLAGEYPVVSGTAASSVFAATAGQSSVRPDARPGADPTGRTTVNFGTPVDPIRPPAAPASTPSALRRPGRGPRRASLQVKRIDPWSVLKLAFVLSVALFFVWLVAVGVLYGVLDGMGVWDRVNGTYNEFAANTPGGSGGPLITASRVFGIAAVIGAINIVLFTALATVGSFVYNVSADLAGGLEITLAERE